MYYTYNMIHKTITIKQIHEEWIEKNTINLSRFVQRKIDEELENE